MPQVNQLIHLSLKAFSHATLQPPALIYIIYDKGIKFLMTSFN